MRSAPGEMFYFMYAFFRVRMLRVQVVMSTHKACMFGAVASVHAWERLGAAICFLARRFLRIAALRYVDDFFAPERYVAG